MSTNPEFQPGTIVTVIPGPASSPCESTGFTGRGIVRRLDYQTGRLANYLIRLAGPEYPELADPADGYGDTWIPAARVTEATGEPRAVVAYQDGAGHWHDAKVEFRDGGCLVSTVERPGYSGREAVPTEPSTTDLQAAAAARNRVTRVRR